MEELTELLLPPQIEAGEINIADQPLRQALGPESAEQRDLMDAQIIADHLNELPLFLEAGVLPGLLHHAGQSGEEIAPFRLKQMDQPLQQPLRMALHQIAEEILLVGEVHVKTAPGDTGLPDDLIDGGLRIGLLGELPPGRAEKCLPLLLRQVEKCVAGHRQTSFPAAWTLCYMTTCHMSIPPGEDLKFCYNCPPVWFIIAHKSKRQPKEWIKISLKIWTRNNCIYKIDTIYTEWEGMSRKKQWKNWDKQV